MMSSSQKLLCEVLFRDYRTGEKITVAGKIDIDRLVSSAEKSIIVENHALEKQRWKKIKSKVPKVDIIKITAFKAQIFLNYEKGDILLDSSASNFQEKIDNSPIIME